MEIFYEKYDGLPTTSSHQNIKEQKGMKTKHKWMELSENEDFVSNNLLSNELPESATNQIPDKNLDEDFRRNAPSVSIFY